VFGGSELWPPEKLYYNWNQHLKSYALKLTELTCSGSTPVQVAGLVLLTLLTIGLYQWGTVQSLKLTKGGSMKKKNISEASLIAKTKPLFISVVMTAHAILASFLGGPPMLA
jgi:hypothetical protein